MPWTVEAWSREHTETGTLQPSEAAVDTGVERAPNDWRPLAPSVAPAPRLVFVDGVRRIDARMWRDNGTWGLCASYAAGAVEVGTAADITAIQTERGLFTRATAADLPTAVGLYRVVSEEGETAVQAELRRLETAVASGVARASGLVIIDGPLSSRHDADAAVGYIKSHRVTYLDDALTATVHRLAPGERTPLFRTTTSWSRYSSYLRLPGPAPHPWAAIARLEVSGDARLEEAKRLVDTAAVSLPRYASIAYKDPRAPQNLYPIGGLERELRRRLGDAALVHRALRRAAAES